jgi:hypothetical protein
MTVNGKNEKKQMPVKLSCLWMILSRFWALVRSGAGFIWIV